MVCPICLGSLLSLCRRALVSVVRAAAANEDGISLDLNTLDSQMTDHVTVRVIERTPYYA